MRREDGVFRQPRARLLLQQEIFPRASPQRAEAGIHPCGVQFQQALLRWRCRCHHLAGHGAQAMRAELAVGVEHLRPQQRRQLASRGAALQVHLKEAFLPVQVAQRVSDIFPGGSDDRGRASSVAHDGNGGTETR